LPAAVDDLVCAGALPDRELCLRVRYVLADLVDEFLQCVRATHAEKAAPVRVGVDVDGGLLAKLVSMRLDPFGRSDQALFFCVPGTIDDRSFRFPAGLGKLRDTASLL